MDREAFIKAAFSRNLGLIDETEQQRLAAARIAVAGAGGVGGLHVLALARLGIGKFRIADFDTFDAVNINRQFGALVSTIGKHKARVIADMARDINPYAEVDVFPNGVTLENLDAFLSGVQVYIDGIDFFEIEIRRAVFKRCRELGIYALTAAPLGFGATLQVFAPGGMTFDDYFGISDGMPYMEKIAAFAAGLAPRPYHIKYLDLSRVSLARKTGPAVSPACTLASSLIATETVKIITGKGVVRPVPHYLQFDMLRNKFKSGYLLWGGKNPLQILMRKMILKKATADKP